MKSLSQMNDKIKQNKRSNLALVLASLLMSNGLMASSNGLSGGMTLAEASGSRASALGEAFVAMQNDISALGYNPASLGSLKSGQASFLFQKGLTEDSYGQFMAGSPLSNGGWGLSVGYYNGGTLDVLSNGVETEVTAQKDLALSLGFSRNIKSMSVGITGKYLSSELAETANANAYAMDLGASIPLSSRLRFGASLQNLGTELKFIEEGDPLPRMFKAGLSLALSPKAVPTTLLFDTTYLMNEKETNPAVGIETWMGPLALRAGYRMGSDENKFSVGTGFILGPSSLDYSFGMANKLDPSHKVSLSFKFGETMSQPLVKREEIRKKPIVKKEETELPSDRSAFIINDKAAPNRNNLGSLESPSFAQSSSRKVYVIKEGDSLQSIAEDTYGRGDMWRQIFMANKYLIEDPEQLPVGMRIVLP